MANEDKIIFPNNRSLAEFALSGSGGGTITGSGTISGATGRLTRWTGQTTIGNSVLQDDGDSCKFVGLTGSFNMNIQPFINPSYIEGPNAATGLRLFHYGDGTAGISVKASTILTTKDCHFGANSGYLRDNNGSVELHLKSGQKFSIVWG